MSRVGCAILAAGASRRLDRPKQLILFRGHELVRHLGLEARRSAADEIAIVVGAEGERIVAAVQGLGLRPIVNFEWREGIASSIRCATKCATDRRLGALILMLSDQPHLDAAHLDRLLAAHARGVTVVASRYGGHIGVPALSAATAFGDLLTLSGDAGAASLLRRHAGTPSIDWPPGEIDIDTPHDLASLLDTLALSPLGAP